MAQNQNTFYGYQVEKVSRLDIRDFIEKWHYSKSINGCIADYCYALYRQGEMIGAMFFGRMAMAGQWKRYADSADEVTELRRLVCIDDTPKNTESWFLSRALKMLLSEAKAIQSVVSYSDLEHGHRGVIYRASNFQHFGFSKGARVIVWGDRQYHDKTIRTKYNGELKPFAKRVKDALDTGEAVYKNTAGKNIFIYHRCKKKREALKG